MREITVRDAINEALEIALNSSDDIFLMGEDIARYGGQLRCTANLVDYFGEERVRDTPISETAIVGGGIGAALAGRRPIVEIPYVDFIGICFDQILNQGSKLRYMYGGHCTVPLVIRTQCGAGLGNAAQHSQSLEAILNHVPGLRVVMPATPYDAKGLLLHAIQDDNPVIFIENKTLYKKKGEVPEEPYEVDYTADIKKKGEDVSIITYSSMLWKSLEAAERLEEKNISAEVIDLRTIDPLDIDTVITSVKKTNHAVVVHEACKNGGMGAEIAAQIQEKAFEHLKAPIKRVAAPDVPVPYAEILENAFVPDVNDIYKGVLECLDRD